MNIVHTSRQVLTSATAQCDLTVHRVRIQLTPWMFQAHQIVVVDLGQVLLSASETGTSSLTKKIYDACQLTIHCVGTAVFVPDDAQQRPRDLRKCSGGQAGALENSHQALIVASLRFVFFMLATAAAGAARCPLCTVLFLFVAFSLLCFSDGRLGTDRR